MSAVKATRVLDAEGARKLSGATEIAVVRRSDGTVVERVKLLRYAGHYRTGRLHAFAVRDAEGKFHVRSEQKLGLTEDSDYVAHVLTSSDGDVTVDLRDSSVAC